MGSGDGALLSAGSLSSPAEGFWRQPGPLGRGRTGRGQRSWQQRSFLGIPLVSDINPERAPDVPPVQPGQFREAS